METQQNYNHQAIEQKWQQKWEEKQLYRTVDPKARKGKDHKKFYGLVEFPYPSGEGLHVGHPRSYTAMDIICRKKRMEGYHVLFPIGFDAFGLPSENYAIKTGIHPSITTKKNIETFTKQLKSLGISFDWDRSIDTTDPDYYRWTQWIFLQLFKKGLAYKANIPINWCLSCKIGLANEEVVNGKCERCEGDVEKRNKSQWMLKITEYADRLDTDLDTVDFLEKIKLQQRNWIGKSEGINILYDVDIPQFSHNIIYLATKNPGKIDRYKKLFGKILPHVSIQPVPDYVEVEENSKDGVENAYQKVIPYKGKYPYPVLAIDTEVHFDGLEDMDPTKVRRNALKGVDEKTLTQKEIADKMVSFYQEIARKFGGKKEFYYKDCLALLYPDGTCRQAEAKREWILTDTVFGEVDIYMPMRCLLVYKATGKNCYEGTESDFFSEMSSLTDSLKKITSLRISVFTTRPDTNFGATFIAVAPDSSFAEAHMNFFPEKEKVMEYVQQAKRKSDLERIAEGRVKTGVFTGLYAINNLNNRKMPIYIADFVLGSVGTGIVVGVPGHDIRDFEFAQAMGLEVIRVVVGKDGDTSPITRPEQVQEEEGTMINSGFLDGLDIHEATKKIMDYVEEKGWGKRVVHYKLRDWVFSRQRYWGEPIPLVYCEHCAGKGENQGENKEIKIKVFTTRSDTLFGSTYVAISPDHPFVEMLKNSITNFEEVKKYRQQAKGRRDVKRTTGIELKGIKTVHPMSNKKIPIWIADYVYGTDAIMAVPAHDERDFDFAKKYGLPIIQSVAPLFTQTAGKDAVKEGVKIEKRKAVIAIVKHWDKDEYLCLDWKKFGWKSFVIGGVEEGESLQDAALREAQEETGFTDIQKVTKLFGEHHDCFYAEHKGVNRYAECSCFVIELASGKQLNSIDTENHTPIWIKAKSVGSFISLESHSYFWNIWMQGEKAYTKDGVLLDSGKFTGLLSAQAREKITQKDYDLQIMNDKLKEYSEGELLNPGWIPVEDDQLPVKLPDVEKYEPTDTGESPLTIIDSWVQTTCPKCGNPARRETDTMPNWAGSSWYFLRYIDPDNNKVLADPEKLKYWMPVDWYNGGMEHTTLHLLYSRFWNKFLCDIGVVPTSEPYQKRTSHGMILGEGGAKMSKSRGNVINPDEVVKTYGADTLRLYEMFMGPFDQAIPWDMKGVEGCYRFLGKIWKAAEKAKEEVQNDISVVRLLHKTIKKVTDDIERMNFNTAVSACMIFMNELQKQEAVSRKLFETFLIIVSPFAPHVTEELWEKLGNKESIHVQSWPVFDPALAKDDEIELVVQVNGKVRGKLLVSPDIAKEAALQQAKEDEAVKKWIEGKTIVKEIFVPGKIVNIVIT